MQLLIKNARILDPETGLHRLSDLLSEDGRIVRIGEDFWTEGASVLNAENLTVAPGLIDMHCHLRDPGFEYKEDLLSGSRAAAAGGFTTVACMPNTKPVCDRPEVVEYLRKKAASIGLVDVLPIASITVGLAGADLSPMATLLASGAVAFSDDGLPVAGRGMMAEGMRLAASLGTRVISHCEQPDFHPEAGLTASSFGLPGCEIPIESDEEAMVAREVALCQETGAPVHIAHVSTRNSVSLVRYAKEKGLPVSAETCPHYLLFTSDLVAQKGTNAKMNPPLRSEQDRLAVIAGLVDGTIDILATDHAPHSAEEKARPFAEAPNGIVGFETALAASLTALVHSGEMSLSEALKKLTVSPAELFGLDVGRIAVGKPCDLVLFDPDEPWTPDPETFLSKSKNSPFGGVPLKGRVHYTIFRGKVAYRKES